MIAMHRSSLLLLVGLLGCQDSFDLPNQPTLTLAFPENVSASLPNRVPGEVVTIAARAFDEDGDPVEGVKIFWSDNRAISSLGRTQSITDSLGIARTTWVMAPLEPSQNMVRRVVNVYLPGAFGNPLQYQVNVYRCVRCGGGDNVR